MYKRDVAEINRFVMDNGPDALVDTGLFVLLTIQAGLSTVKGSIKKVRFDGMEADCLWGQKAAGYQYLQDNKSYLFGKAFGIAETKGYYSVEACADVIDLFMSVPNLGMVKAAFLAQCLGFETACIDSHNLTRLGLEAKDVSVSKKIKPELRRQKILDYVKLTQKEGAEYWWDTWCEYVAGNAANRQLNTGDVVSYYHTECIKYSRDLDTGPDESAFNQNASE